MADLPIPVTPPAAAARAGTASANARGLAQRDGAMPPGSAGFPDALAQEVGIAAGQVSSGLGVATNAAQAGVASKADDDDLQTAAAADARPAFSYLLTREFGLTSDGQASPGPASSATAAYSDHDPKAGDDSAQAANQACAKLPVLAPDVPLLAPVVPDASAAPAPPPAVIATSPPLPIGFASALAPQGAAVSPPGYALSGTAPSTPAPDPREAPFARIGGAPISISPQDNDNALNAAPSAADLAVTGKSQSGSVRTTPVLGPRDPASPEVALALAFAAGKGHGPQDRDVPPNATPGAADLSAPDKAHSSAARGTPALAAPLSAAATNDVQHSSDVRLDWASSAADFAMSGKPLAAASAQSRREITFDRSLPEQHTTLVASNAIPAYAAPVQLAQAPATALNPAVGESGWNQALGDQLVWMAGHKHQVAQLHLNPPDLGPLSITLTLDNDKASAQFFSAHTVVRDAIESAMPRLREMLADSGITLGNANVSAEPFHDPAQQQLRHEAHAYFASSASLTSDADALAPGARLARLSHGLIDIFA